MYTLKVSHGYVDEPETETVEVLGIYETLEEACTAAENKFSEIYVTYGAFDAELGRVFAGYDHYYKVTVNER